MRQRIGKYEIQAELGSGGFGKVYRAFDPTVGRLVAVKVLMSGVEESAAARFRTEASSAGNLKHKNIVTIHEFGEDQGMLYLVMEYLEGKDLSKVITNSAHLSIVEKMRIMAQVAEGLQCAHQGGVVHRDIKPANIMLLPDGSVKIMDFGIARLTSNDSMHLTQSGFVVGTVAYMAPEQLNGFPSDALCDIWSYGTIYYELLTGQHPFYAPDTAAVMFRVAVGPIIPLREMFPSCPENLDTVVSRLLTRDRDARYQSLEDVILDTVPILRELERNQTTSQMAQAQIWAREERYDEALALLKEVLQADPVHREARALREQLQRHVHKRTTQAKVQKLREQAENAAGGNKFRDAIEALKSAARIDPHDTSLLQRISELEKAKAQREKLDELLSKARNDLALNNPTEAIRSLREAVGLAPHSKEAGELLAAAQSSAEDRDRQRKLQQGLGRAKGLLTERSFAEAVTTLEALDREIPGNTQVRELLNRSREQLQEHEQRQKIQDALSAANAALKFGDLVGAADQLERVVAIVPDHAEAAELLNTTREQIRTRERATRLRRLAEHSRLRLNARDFIGALRLVDEALTEAPEDESLRSLRQTIYQNHQESKRRAAIEKALQEVEKLKQRGRLDGAFERLDAAVRELGDDAEFAQARKDLDQKRIQGQVQEAVTRAHGLEESREWTAALGVIEAALRQNAGASELRDSENRLRAKVALEGDLEAINERMADEDWAAAIAMISASRQSHGDHTAFHELENRASAEQRRNQADRLATEIQRHLAVNEIEKARLKFEEYQKKYSLDSKMGALAAEISKAWLRLESLEAAAGLLRQGEYRKAQEALGPLLVQDPADREARSLYERAEIGQQREQERKDCERGRTEARQFLQQIQFDKAIECLRSLIAQYPEDNALQSDLQAAQDAKTGHARREFIAAGRKQAESLCKQREFDQAIARLQQIQERYPGEPLVEADLQAACTAKAENDRRVRYEAARQQAAARMRDRDFAAAQALLTQLLSEFPGDSVLESELQSARQAGTLQQKQARIEHELKLLQSLQQRGEASLLRQESAALLKEIEDPRVRELHTWAQRELSRTSVTDIPKANEPAQASPWKKLVWAIPVVAVAGIAAVWFGGRPQPDTAFTVSPTELSFVFDMGSAAPGQQVIRVEASQPRRWKATVSDPWVRIQPAAGTTPAQLLVSVDPVGRDPGVLTSSIVLSAEGAEGMATSVAVRLRIEKSPQSSNPPDGQTNTPPPQSGTPTKENKQVANSDPRAKTKFPPQTRPYEPPAGTTPVTPKEEPKEKSAPPVATSTSEVLPPIVNCRSADYFGRERGELTWIGEAAPGAIITFTSGRGGPFRGTPLPGCEVALEIVTPGTTVVELPNAGNHYSRAKVQNAGAGVLTSIQLRWSVKR